MINASIIQDSICAGQRITTFELIYPRYIHSEIMTHRLFSRNAASSRAVPIEKTVAYILEHSVDPIWTHNRAGMTGELVTDMHLKGRANHSWGKARKAAILAAEELCAMGIHKQNANRLLEPFTLMKTVLTATDFDNFFNLRCHPDAQPEFQQLAKAMQMQMTVTKPMVLRTGEWHVPYVKRQRVLSKLMYFVDGQEVSSEQATQVSASCCAQVSYRLSDTSLAKAISIYDRLVTARPVHASPFEHQAKALGRKKRSRNFVGWQQLRVDIEANLEG